MDWTPYSNKIIEIWNAWEIRLLVLLSLLLQITLIIFGSRRKYISRSWIWILVWLTYLTADWMATVALGNLATNQGNSEENCPDPNSLLQALWAPFLLLHLGGPDSITAYSLEDNELYLRHGLGLLVQVTVAFYVFIRSWSTNVLTFIAILMFVPGIIKYGERTFVLWSSSAERFKDSLISSPDPSPGLIKRIKGNPRAELRDHGGNILAAYFLFRRFAHLYAGLLLNSFEAMESSITFDYKSAEDVFTIISVELGFMYDLLFTKTKTVYSPVGIVLRCVSFLSSVIALIIFSTMIRVNDYSRTDISITYVLLVGAIILEVYASVLHFFSDWTKLCLTQYSRENPKIYKATCAILDSPLFNDNRWSGTMGQFSLIRYCIRETPFKCIGIEKLILKLIRLNKFVEKYMHLTREKVTKELQEAIFGELMAKMHKYQRATLFNDFEVRRKILAQRGDYVLQSEYQGGNQFGWCTVDVEFDHSLLIWHIATDLCFHQDSTDIPQRKTSKRLSDYMLYLLVLYPAMMPKGIAELRYTETCDEAKKFLQIKQGKKYKEPGDACKVLLETVGVGTTDATVEENDLSVLSSGCKLARQLQALDLNWQEKWRMISRVWIEMLGYAANHCDWNQHGQHLRNGGQLLTHVCLLMTHLGFSEQYRLYARDIS